MLQEKRERRPPTPFQSLVFQAPAFRKEPVHEKKRKLSTCTYETIPPPIKYDYPEETLLLFGNFTVLQKNHDLFTDFSLLNEYHIYNDIQVVQQQNQKIVSASTERRADARFARWKSTAKRMTKSRESDMRSWGKAVKNYSLQYEGAMNAYWNQIKKIMLKQDWPEELSSLKSAADKKKSDLMEKYPCIQLTSLFKGYENRLSKISFNEKIIQFLGYTTDSFASNILREGIPRIIPLDNQEASEFLKKVLNDCSQKKDVNFSTAEYECPFLTKSGYIRNVKVEVHILMNYDIEDHGNDSLLVIKDLGSFSPPSKSRLEINDKFLETKCLYEQEMSEFLSAYYNFSLTMTSLYSNVDKICQVTDVEFFESY